MRVLVLNKSVKWSNSLFLENDVIIIPNDYSAVEQLRYEKFKIHKSMEIILSIVPELKNHIIENSKVMFGLDLANKILNSLNPNYSFSLVDDYKINSLTYSKMIYEGILPLSTTCIESWSHDFYLHGMGAKDISCKFTNWYKRNYNTMSDEDRIVMSAIVEFTSIKHVEAFYLSQICHPNQWGDLSSFFHDIKIKNNQLSEIFKKHKAEAFFAETLGENYAQG